MWRWLWIILFSLATAYLGYYGLYGKRGYYAWHTYKEQLRTLQQTLTSLNNKKRRIGHHIGIMNTQIDKDLLEQLSWRIFRYIKPQDKVILYENKDYP